MHGNMNIKVKNTLYTGGTKIMKKEISKLENFPIIKPKSRQIQRIVKINYVLHITLQINARNLPHNDNGFGFIKNALCCL
jgi:hypothetical protein